jgi:dextranase
VDLPTLKTRYPDAEAVVLSELPRGTASVLCRTAFGKVHPARLVEGSAVLTDLPVGTHAIECWSPDGALLAEDFTTISRSPGDDPVMGFTTSFGTDRVHGVLSWLRQLRCTVVQFYDWMQRYSAPLAMSEEYADPLGRPLRRSSLGRLVAGVRELGAVAQAYAPVCAAEPGFAERQRNWLLFRNDGASQHLGDLLEIMDPGSAGWQDHWLSAYGSAAEAIGFDGFHLDTYGYPRRALDATGTPLPMEVAYQAFAARVRAALPSATLSFNQVNGVPARFTVPAPPAFRYVEVWPPNDRWRHLEGLIARSGGRDLRPGVLAIYPPVWKGGRAEATRTVALTEAVATVLGAGLLVLGDDVGVLSGPYYPVHERLQEGEAAKILEWHRFALRCRDLFRDGEDTSWCDVGDENGAVRVEGPGVVASPEPTAGTLFVRVARTGPTTAISCLDLSGSAAGSWAEPTTMGKLRGAQIKVLVTAPDRCRAAVAVLGVAGGRFQEVELTPASHREGRAVELRLPIASGWSVALVNEAH